MPDPTEDSVTLDQIKNLIGKARDRCLTSDEADRLLVGVLELCVGKDW